MYFKAAGAVDGNEQQILFGRSADTSGHPLLVRRRLIQGGTLTLKRIYNILDDAN